MDGRSESGNDFLDGIYQGRITPTLTEGICDSFKPWHKPRKQYIRLHQWVKEIRNLQKGQRAGTADELRYLGLPGEDLLDIRVLESICTKAGLRVRYLGFDSSLKSPRLNLSRHEVNSARFIHPSSVVIRDRLEDLCSDRSPAYQYVMRGAPFDVINLDLCNSVTRQMPDGIVPNIEAIRTLCDVQALYGHPWLLFLTTRVMREGLASETKRRLFSRLMANVEDSGFAEALNSMLALNPTALHAELDDNERLEDIAWFHAYVLSVSKWLLHYMMDHEVRVQVIMRPSYAYSICGGSSDMASLAFLMEPVRPPRQDDTGLTKSRSSTRRVPSETELARSLIDVISDIQNVDQLLENDPFLKNKMTKKTVGLLVSAGYDVTKYQAFLAGDT